MAKQNEIELVKALSKVFTSFKNVIDCFVVPKELWQSVSFLDHGLVSVAESKEDRVWRKIKLKDYVGIDLLSEMTTSLVYTVMKVATIVNTHRLKQGKKYIDFVEEAARIDKRTHSDALEDWKDWLQDYDPD